MLRGGGLGRVLAVGRRRRAAEVVASCPSSRRGCAGVIAAAATSAAAGMPLSSRATTRAIRATRLGGALLWGATGAPGEREKRDRHEKKICALP